MLNRRHLRIKALHYLYAFNQSGNTDVPKMEKELLSGVEKVNELFLWYASLFNELVHYANIEIERGKNKRLPGFEDLNPNLRFVENKVFQSIIESKELNNRIQQKKISWVGEQELVKKIFSELKNQAFFVDYMTKPDFTFETERAFAEKVCTRFFPFCEPLQFFLEEKNIVWVDDHEVVLTALQRTIKKIKDQATLPFLIPSLYKDEEDDRKFMLELFRKTIMPVDSFEEMISEKAKNWEIERLAVIDVILIKMALTEAIYFQNIPVKVTLNEYIELAKQYSTPKSQQFVNGILDSLFVDLKKSGRIKKTGRGLVE
jgi:transcription antitermination protein NusB